MQRVNGTQLKASLSMACAKQVAAHKLRVGTYAVTFSGTKAFAEWRLGNYNARERNFRINYPALADDALLSRAEADLIAAYTLHETGHVLFSQNDQRVIRDKAAVGDPQRQTLHPFYNGIEDGRMEASVIDAGIARGAVRQFQRLLAMLVGNIAKGWTPCDIMHAPFALAMLSRDALGNGNEFTHGLLDRIPEPHRSVYAKVYEACKSAPMGYDSNAWSWSIAKQFMADWNAMRQGQGVPQQPEPQQGGDGSTGEPQEQDDGETEFDDQGDSERAPSSDDASERALGDEDAEDAEDAEEGEEGESDDAGTSEGEGEDAEEGDAFGGESGEGDEGDEGGDWGDDSDAAGGDAAGDGGAATFADLGDSSRKPIAAEPSVDGIFKRAAEKFGAGDPTAFQHAASYDIRRQVEQQIEWASRSHSRPAKADIDAPIGALKTQLSKLLLSVDRIGWKTGTTSGRFDVRRTSRMLAGSECVFKSRTESQAVTTAVAIVGDFSGSMSGESAHCLAKAMWAISTAIERVGCDVIVTGLGSDSDADMRSGALGRGKYSYGWGGDGKQSKSTTGGEHYSQGSVATVKDWHQSCGARREVFEAIPSMVGGGTPDYHVTRTVAEQLLLHPAQRKLVLCVTDGCGEGYRMGAWARDFEKRHGVPILGIGIKTGVESMKVSYPRFAIIQDAAELSTTAIRSLIKQIEAGPALLAA
jgi:hypothetical protein